MTTEKTTGYNTRFASCGVTCLNSSSVFQLGFGRRLTVLCTENPHERKAWERYATALNDDTINYIDISVFDQFYFWADS